MSRPRGLPKTGGRQRGTPNRKTDELAAKLAKLGCDPIEGLARIAMAAETVPELKVRCYAELAGYIHAKRKAVELRPDEDNEIRVIVTGVDGSPLRRDSVKP
jgi:hypothetical protein